MSADGFSQFDKPAALRVEVGSQIHIETLAKRKTFVYSVSRMYCFSVLLLNLIYEGH
ncbi:hypothetical protein PhiBtE2641_20 [Burkholderia phage PhiBt-E264.1]|nr:hypothetical protein PhiBtE2641_20 [Burkholderia phage PhiBt-E264.1]